MSQRRRGAIRDLERLNDRMLADIGVSRSQIGYLVDRQLAAAEERDVRFETPRQPSRTSEAAENGSGAGTELKHACC